MFANTMRDGVLWLVIVAVAAWGAEGLERPFVVTGIIHTSASSSPVYQLPTWESPVSIFGVEADGDAHLTLLNLVNGRSLNISLEIRAYDNESQVTGSGVGDLLSVVTQDNIALDLDEFAWFSIWRTKQGITVYEASTTDPFLLYFNNNTVNETDFRELNAFQVSSLRNASWDFIGDKYDDENEATVPKDLKSELQAVVEGFQPRLSVIETFKKTSLSQLDKSNIRDLASELYWAKSYLMLINYFGYKIEGRNTSEVISDINKMIDAAGDTLSS
ncbi:hypothetical protein E2C01_021716 [Portunus trituberculatus]|uniref:Uncharacterized protein n=1 Tax=Portunus trituberculatus TaxID=210409 RepID=A0A5B7E3G4_PORTR|nr:hypothetical protein [Portunus trituberculatus]